GRTLVTLANCSLMPIIFGIRPRVLIVEEHQELEAAKPLDFRHRRSWIAAQYRAIFALVQAIRPDRRPADPYVQLSCRLLPLVTTANVCHEQAHPTTTSGLMKTMTMFEARNHFARTIEAAKKDVAIVTRNGRPVAAIQAIDDDDIEDLLLERSE